MPLSPEDVHGKQFSTVRMRTGYDMDEVDSFLDEVEAELIRLHAENDELRAEVAAAEARAEEAPPPPPPAAAVPEPAAAPPAQAPPPANEQALRMLELAQKTADGAIAAARADAERILGDARTKATAQTKDAEAQRTALEQKIAELRAFEREYRTRLRGYFEAQLRELDGRGGVEPAGSLLNPAVAMHSAGPSAPAPAPHVGPAHPAAAGAAALQPPSGPPVHAGPPPGAVPEQPAG